MATSNRYSDIKCYAIGALLTEENQVKITRDPALKEVPTVAKGIAGMVRGAPVTKIQIRSAVPATGVEFDPGPYMESGEQVEFTFFRANKQLTGKFFITGDDSSHQTNSESDLNFDLLAPGLLQWQ